MPTWTERVQAMLRQSPYQAYLYGYPHKTAYRPFAEPLELRQLWASEECAALSLYAHIPFCGMRCGFCNLFTQANPESAAVESYLDALAEESRQVRQQLPDAVRVAQLTLGGGTPSYLSVAQMRRLLDALRAEWGATPGGVAFSSVEVSPDTLTPEKVAQLAEAGFRRVSMGVQSFVDRESRQAGRPQAFAQLEAALRLLRDARFPTLNLDLIYGLPEQTPASWRDSLRAALEWEPEEIYLYPLYVRPLTGLGRRRRGGDDFRLALYRVGREALRAEGYQQVSMRCFRRPRPAPSPRVEADLLPRPGGMLGLGCGARSYTRGVHYSCEYAVAATGVREILRDYLGRGQFAAATYGYQLDEGEQRRRLVALSLMNLEGLSLADYRERFGAEAEDDFPQLAALEEFGLLDRTPTALFLTERGLEHSDAIGPLFFSAEVEARMGGYVPR